MFGSDSRWRNPWQRAHRRLVDRGAGQVEGDRLAAGHRHLLPVRCRQDLIERRGDPVDGARRDGRARRVGLGVPDRGDRPVHGTAARLRDRRDVGDRVVHDLDAEGAGDVLAVLLTGDAAPMFVPGAM